MENKQLKLFIEQAKLRSKGIDILVGLSDNPFEKLYVVHTYKFGELKHIGPNKCFKTYEDALEYGIKNVLKL